MAECTECWALGKKLKAKTGHLVKKAVAHNDGFFKIPSGTCSGEGDSNSGALKVCPSKHAVGRHEPFGLLPHKKQNGLSRIYCARLVCWVRIDFCPPQCGDSSSPRSNPPRIGVFPRSFCRAHSSLVCRKCPSGELNPFPVEA